MSIDALDDNDKLERKFQQRAKAARNPLETVPANILHQGYIPNTPLASATIAFLLGGVCSLGFYTAANNTLSTPLRIPSQLGLYIASWAFFHWAEFAVTAGWNLEKCSVDSFLLENGAMYHIAHGVAVFEYLVSTYFFPSAKTYPYVSQIGLTLIILGQTLRSIAMIHASTNFSHAVAFYKREDHRLVTDGVYNWFRHPSYAGFYYWALGTQLLVQNPISFILFAIVMWRFFYYRTRAEERALIKFFGEEYITYRQRVGTKIPFVP